MKRSRVWSVVIPMIALVGSTPARAQFDQMLKALPQLPGAGRSAQELSQDKVGAGLKEALQVGTQNAVNFTGRVDGYLLNEAIKILMPERLRALERGLRTVGYGPQLDEFVVSMNRAAERAAPAAKQIFWDAIGEMTFEDARKILKGSDTAATDYFKGKTTDRLTKAFQPVVEKSMNEVGVTRQYKDLLTRAEAIPFLRLESFDLDRYVVAKALDGLFFVVSEEEKKIRTNPVARTTSLLKEVFGQR